MTKEELISKLSDTGIESETLDAVLKNLLTFGDINVRRLVLPTDKKVLTVTPIGTKDRYLVANEVLIFKTIIRKMNEFDYDKLMSFGIDNNILNKLNKLTDEEIIEYIQNSVFPGNDRSIVEAMVSITKMSSLADAYGSKTKDIFEEKKQETKYKHREGTEQYTKRIYLNLPLNKIAIDFLTLYKLKCIEKGIPSKMKGMGSGGYEEGDLDTTILYSNDYYLAEHVSILESIIKERPDLVNNFGAPVISGARVLSNNGEYYYTIASGLLNDNTSNGYYDKLYKVSFAFLCSKYIDEVGKYDIPTLCTMKNVELKQYISMLIDKIYQQSKESIINDGLFKQIVCQVSSYLRFDDFNHNDVPLYQDEIFINYVNDNKKANLDTPIEEDTSELYLYHTEELFEKVIFDFMNSELPSDKRVITYINRMKQIEKEYRKYARQTVGFAGSPRHIQVNEYLKTLPNVSLFVEDVTKGNGINMVMAKKYYDELATKLESSFGQSDTPKKL